MTKNLERELRSKRGTFKITREQYQDLGIQGIQDAFGALMFMPFRAEHIFESECFVYSGYSPVFIACEDGEPAREYLMDYECIDGEIGCLEFTDKITGDMVLSILPEYHE